MRPNRSFTRWATALFVVAAIIGCVVVGRTLMTGPPTVPADLEHWENSGLRRVSYTQEVGANLRGGIGWINSGPIALSELRGKIVLLD